MRSRRFVAAVALVSLIAGAGWLALSYEGTGGEMTKAAERFLTALSDEHRTAATMEYDNKARSDWHFIPKASRKGLQIKEMSASERKAAHTLLRSSLSQIGYEKAETIMALEAILRELEKARVGGNIRDPERYYFTVFGKPTLQGRWGWSCEGHHLSLNFAIEDGKILSTTPTFFGANPADVRDDVAGAPKRGTRVLRKEEELAFELFNSLTDEQRKICLLDEKAPADIRGPADVQPNQAAPEGLAVQGMTSEQAKTLRALITVYTDNVPKDVAEARWAAIEKNNFEKIHFAWAGPGKPGVGHYYRVQGPSFLIELNNTQPDASGNKANHIHSVWRNMGGDFGENLKTAGK